jgi:hypothetical protein
VPTKGTKVSMVDKGAKKKKKKKKNRHEIKYLLLGWNLSFIVSVNDILATVLILPD